MTEIDQEMHGIIIDVLQSKLTTPSLTEVEEYDAVLILGEDVTNHAPRLALSVRQATRNLASEMAGNTQIPQWHDAAVRVLAQNHRSPLIVVTPTEDRLDEVASSSMRLMPRDIAELGYALAEEIAGNTTSSTPDVEAIARTLLEAKKPLVISGSSSQSPDILKAAVNLSLALKDRNDRAGIFLCANECNSVGVAMIDNERSISELLSTSPSVVVVLENDLSIRLGQQFSSSISSVNNLIAIDHLDNSTTSASSVVLPAATFAEAEGTLVNSEGRAQRSMAVYKAQDEIKAGYHLIDALAGNERSSTEVRSELSEQIPALAGILKAAPESDFRFEGAKFPRMTHRSSGRTAMRADISVHEPKQPVDEESALSFSMEGNQQQAPASLRAYTWSPGWNSNQSVHKFQSEVGGEYVGGDSGYLLFRESVDIEPFSKSTQAYSALIPRYHIFGSDELSAESEELSTLIPRPYLRINNTTAKNLKVEQGDGLMCTINNGNLQFAVIVDEAIPDNTFVYPIIPETRGMNGISSTDFSRVDDWVQDMDPLSPKTITTDRSS
jgi:NADH-quinone oxidoreductase subunit G